tara:strand:+ start:170 stop:460 length:291 start_codon:yes stop_codon:yes gene_type:complete
MVGDKGQISTTKALLKFCSEHGCSQFWIERLTEIVNLLVLDDKMDVLIKYKLFKGGGMGSFLDFWPEVSFEHETPEYLEVIWWSLLGHWRSQMDRL